MSAGDLQFGDRLPVCGNVWLIFKYIRVARHEEREVPYLADYHSYREKVPFLT